MSDLKATDKPPIKEPALQGFRDLSAMRGLMEWLCSIRAGKPKFLISDYGLLVFMWLYNLVIDSLLDSSKRQTCQ